MFAATAVADDAPPPVGASVTLVSENTAIAPGETFTVALHVRHAPGYHTYWKSPGVVGMATRIEWDLPDGFRASAIRWQQPQLTKMAAYTVWGYEDDTLLLVDITPPADLKPGARVALRGKAVWMACARNCHPNSGAVSLTLPVASESVIDATWRGRFDKVRQQQPRELSAWRARVTRRADHFELALSPVDREAANTSANTPYCFDEQRLVASDLPQRFERRGDTLVLRLPIETRTPDESERFRALLYTADGWLADGTARAMRVDVPMTE